MIIIETPWENMNNFEYALDMGLIGKQVVTVYYEQDNLDRKFIEIGEVDFRGIDILSDLKAQTIGDIFDACYKHGLNLAVGAAENRADSMRDGS